MVYLLNSDATENEFILVLSLSGDRLLTPSAETLSSLLPWLVDGNDGFLESCRAITCPSNIAVASLIVSSTFTESLHSKHMWYHFFFLLLHAEHPYLYIELTRPYFRVVVIVSGVAVFSTYMVGHVVATSWRQYTLIVALFEPVTDAAHHLPRKLVTGFPILLYFR